MKKKIVWTKWRFKGWTCESEKKQTDRWETFTVGIYAEESGELFEKRDMERALKASGFRLILEPIRRRK